MDLNCSSLSTIAPAVRISFAISQCNDRSHPKVIYGARLEGIARSAAEKDAGPGATSKSSHQGRELSGQLHRAGPSSARRSAHVRLQDARRRLASARKRHPSERAAETKAEVVRMAEYGKTVIDQRILRPRTRIEYESKWSALIEPGLAKLGSAKPEL